MRSFRLAVLATSGLLLATAAGAYTLFDDGGANNRRWSPSNNVNYLINQNGSDDIAFASLRPVIVNSYGEWTTATGGTLTYVDGGNTALTFNLGDGSNVVDWLESNWAATTGLPTGVLAFAQPTIFGSGFIAECDIRFNGDTHTWSITGAPNGTFDVMGVLVHESGHMSGLDHTPVLSATMFPSAPSIGQGGDSGTRQGSPAADDAAGVNALYNAIGVTGSIAGTIDSDFGGQGMAVCAVNTSTGDTVCALTGSRVGEANEDYRIDRLAPGNYALYVMPLDDLNFGMTTANTAMSGEDSVFQPRFYTSADSTGTADPGALTLVTVTSGSTTSGIDIDPPDASPTNNLYYAALTNNYGPVGAELTASGQTFRFGYSNGGAGLAPQLLGPAGNTLAATSNTGFFFAGSGIGGEDVDIWQTTATLTEGTMGALLTLALRHNGNTEVDFLPGAVELGFAPTPPPVTVTVNQNAGQPDPTNATPVVFAANFSEDVMDFTFSDVTFSGTATVTGGNISGGPQNYLINVTTISTDGTVIAALGPNVVTSVGTGADNLASTSTDNSVLFDTTGPVQTVMSLAPGQTTPTMNLPINFRANFDTPVVGFTGADVNLTTGLPGTPSITVTPASVTPTMGPFNIQVDFAPMPVVMGTVDVRVMGAGITDAAGNAATVSGNAAVQYLGPSPTVTVNQAAGQGDPTNALPILFDVAFSEDVSGFDILDVTFGGTAMVTGGAVTGGPQNYQIEATTVTMDGTVTASIAASAATGLLSGSASLASTSTDNVVTLDTVPPILTTVARAPGQASPTATLPVNFEVTFDGPINGFVPADVDTSASTLPGTYNVSILPVSRGVSGPFTVTVDVVPAPVVAGDIVISILGSSVTDDAGNAGAGGPAGASVTFDPTTQVLDFRAYD